MNRIFICGAFNFPRGGASSNYVQYFGMALQKCGYEVHIVTTKNKEYSGTNYKDLVIDEIKYRNSRILHYFDFKTGARNAVLDCIRSYGINKNDILILYSHNLWFHKRIKSFCIGKKIKVGAVVVEYFSKEQFGCKLDFIFYDILTRKVLPQYDFVFPISTYIERKLSGGRAKQMVLPIMADPYEYAYMEKYVEGTRKFIFPAKGRMKDALENMVLAIRDILCDTTADAEFHFCGVKEKAIREIMQVPESQDLDKRIVLHGWLDYAELIKLYQEMHFLLLARETNEMTKANFPSKVPELLCYGVIPIASKVGDYTEYYLIDGRNSLLITGCEVETIKGAIEQAMQFDDDNLKRLSQAARKTACNLLNYEIWQPKIGEFLETIE